MVVSGAGPQRVEETRLREDLDRSGGRRHGGEWSRISGGGGDNGRGDEETRLRTGGCCSDHRTDWYLREEPFMAPSGDGGAAEERSGLSDTRGLARWFYVSISLLLASVSLAFNPLPLTPTHD